MSGIPWWWYALTLLAWLLGYGSAACVDAWRHWRASRRLARQERTRATAARSACCCERKKHRGNPEDN